MASPISSRSATSRPAQHRLRVSAFDPGMRAQLDTLSISEFRFIRLLGGRGCKNGHAGFHLRERLLTPHHTHYTRQGENLANAPPKIVG